MIVGIDLGTTNSLVAWLSPDGPRLIPNALGEVLTPSVVGIDHDDSIIVGRAAKELQVVSPERCASVFKRLMGTDRTVSVAGREFRAEELSAIVLKSLAEHATAILNQPAEAAVITVPAYFSELQRQATIRAGELAGLHVRRIINEPTAAAIAYGLHELDRERVALVFDLGGGTFDVSILDQFDSTLEIRSSAGEVFLGGEDFTRSMASEILKAKKKSFEHVELRHPLLLSRLLLECESAKRRLSDGEVATIRFPGSNGTIDQTSERISVTLEQFQKWTSRLMEKVRLPLQRAFSDAGVNRSQIDEVILVGGATRMSKIRSMLMKTFGKEPRNSLNPDHVVALGAAIQGGLVEQDKAVSDMVVTDVAPFTLGVEVAKDVAGTVRDGYFFPVISRNTTIPVSRVEQFSTMSPNQTSVKVKLYQGEGRRTDDNLFLGEFELNGIPRGPAGQQIDIRFTYDLNGVLEVEAIASGRKATHVVTRHARSLSGEQLQLALKRMQQLKADPREDQANRHLLKKADRVYRELPLDIRQHLEVLIHGFEEALQLQDPVVIARNKDHLEGFLNQFDEFH